MKRLTFVIVVLALCGTSLGIVYDKLEQQFLPTTSDILLLGMPDGFEPKSIRQAYRGQHPALQTRPAENFIFPIKLGEVGPVEPLFAGKNEYPFLCATERSGFGQPLVDNQAKVGISIYGTTEQGKKNKTVVGYSQDCLLPTQIVYFLKNEKDGGFTEVADKSALADTVSQLIRVEVGTINRFIYVLALPVAKADAIEKFDASKWNQRLIYRFKGGVGVGREQGSVNVAKLLYEHEAQLQDGYGLAFSTGTQTSNHYNIWLSEDTALRVKQQFARSYGEPMYTVGIGGSGGAIQQYLLAQNHPGIIDAAIPLYSYPDMTTQVTYALDCELLEYYFDVASGQKKWQQWANRSQVEGSNARQDFKNRYGNLQGIASLLNGDLSQFPNGASECTNGWRGPAQHINNPQFFSHYNEITRETLLQVDWSHWGNLRDIYGTDQNGFANRFWDNQGVQYGLQALKNGQLSIRDFIDLNQTVGGWKPPAEMENERFWHISGDDSLQDLTLWSQHNMTHEGQGGMAKRSVGSNVASQAAYDAGLVFLGIANLPIIDLRHYLDDQLDMHHSVASFVSRQRIQNAMGNSDHQLIWMMQRNDKLSRRDILRSLPIKDALLVLDQWIINMRSYPEKSLAQNRPSSASDRCYDLNGNVIDSGEATWDGQWNNKPVGACQQQFPHYQTSRLAAGGSIYSDTLQCKRIPVSKAIARGIYGDVNMQVYRQQLESIFPNGVCDNNPKPNERVTALIKRIQAHKG